MKNNKTVKVLIKVKQRIYDKNPEIQEVIYEMVIEVYAVKRVYQLKRYFFIFAFSMLLSL